MQISRITHGPSDRGIDRLTAVFRGFSFSPHRHDTYAVGITTGGIQAFTYRGATRHSARGQSFVLHPDERHDGRAGDDRGFAYRIAYIDPALILAASEGRGLPFVCEPVSGDRQLYAAVNSILSAPDDRSGELATTCNVVALSDALWRAARRPTKQHPSLDHLAMAAVRDALLHSLDDSISLNELEQVSGMSRWQLARQFRRAYSISPYRFHLLRRLEQARRLLDHGHSLADIAQICGFADQAHLSRKFKGAYGASPGQWRGLLIRHGTGGRAPLRCHQAGGGW